MVRDTWHPCCVFPGACCLCSAGRLAAPQTDWRFVIMRPEAEGPDYRQTKHCCVPLGSRAEHRSKNCKKNERYKKKKAALPAEEEARASSGRDQRGRLSQRRSSARHRNGHCRNATAAVASGGPNSPLSSPSHIYEEKGENRHV